MEEDKGVNMKLFNTYLDEKRRYGTIIFWWILIFATITASIGLYKWAGPIVRVERVPVEKAVFVGKTETRTITVKDLGTLRNRDIVQWGNTQLCVSSIEQTRIANYSGVESEPPIKINLRPRDC